MAGIKQCKAAGAEEVEAMSDSQLVVIQVNGEYEARNANMVKYLQAVSGEIRTLKKFTLVQVPWSEKNQADALSKLASSAQCDSPRTVFWEVKEKRSVEEE